MGKTTNITEQEALKALSDIEGNPRRDGQDEKDFAEAISTLENFIRGKVKVLLKGGANVS
jgi:hypothetical protein